MLFKSHDIVLLSKNFFSSNINEVIRAISSLSGFFYEKILHTKKAQKGTKTHISEQKQKKAAFLCA